MGKKQLRNINFRQTKSERSATRSYKGFGKYIKESQNSKVKSQKYPSASSSLSDLRAEGLSSGPKGK